jgi:crotonyl-CoA carboxylase/reductase
MPGVPAVTAGSARDRAVKVRDWMRFGVLTCGPNTPAEVVAEILRAHDVSALVVVDPDGFAVGLISRTDLVDAMFARSSSRQTRGLARDLMSSPVVCVHADAPIEEAVRLIQARKIHRVVVTVPERKGERPIGILSVTDLVGRLEEALRGPIVRPGGSASPKEATS